jgi:hypothetical protein
MIDHLTTYATDYGGFVLEPDGSSVAAVCHRASG